MELVTSELISTIVGAIVGGAASYGISAVTEKRRFERELALREQERRDALLERRLQTKFQVQDETLEIIGICLEIVDCMRRAGNRWSSDRVLSNSIAVYTISDDNSHRLRKLLDDLENVKMKLIAHLYRLDSLELQEATKAVIDGIVREIKENAQSIGMSMSEDTCSDLRHRLINTQEEFMIHFQ